MSPSEWSDERHIVIPRHAEKVEAIEPRHIAFDDVAIFVEKVEVTAPVRSPSGTEAEHIGDQAVFVLLDADVLVQREELARAVMTGLCVAHPDFRHRGDLSD